MSCICNPVTVQFGVGEKEGETRLGDGDRSEINFRDSANHDHYGKGDGPNDNGTTRGQYTGYGSDGFLIGLCVQTGALFGLPYLKFTRLSCSIYA